MRTTEIYRNETPRLELRAEGDGEPTIVGYAAVFGVESREMRQDGVRFREVVDRRAFDAHLEESPDVKARVEHEGGLATVGRTTNGTLRLRADEVGLRYEVDPPDTVAGRDLVTLVGRGDIDQSSFAFSLRGGEEGEDWKQKPDGSWLRTLVAVNVHDVAPTGSPAYPDTTVGVRSLPAAVVGGGGVPGSGGYRAGHRRRRLELHRKRLRLEG